MANVRGIVEQTWELVRDWRHSSQYPQRPESLSFEITAACDAKCIHCPRQDMDRPMKAMPMPLFRKLVDEAAELKIPYLCPNGYGEISTIPVPALEEYLAYIADRSHRFKVVLNTNGFRMTEDRIRLYIKYKVHVVNVTIDGATAETAEAIRKQLKFDQIEANIKQLIAMRNAAGQRRPHMRVAMIAMPQTMPEIPAFFERWRGIADGIAIGGFTTRLQSVSETWRQASKGEEPPRHPNRAGVCVLPFRDLNIWSDGSAVLCCEDWNVEQKMGDLNTQSLSEIWHSPGMTAVRRQHMAGRGADNPLCAKCHNWHTPSRTIKLWS